MKWSPREHSPASASGELLWKVRSEIMFMTAGLIGVAGTLLFVISAEEQPLARKNPTRFHQI